MYVTRNTLNCQGQEGVRENEQLGGCITLPHRLKETISRAGSICLFISP